MFSRVLVANRGEIAVRITRTCHDLGVQVVAVHSDPDRRARHVSLADQSVHLPGVTPAETYLDVEALIAAAHTTGAEAVHPGYGFLSERADAARAFIDAGLVWIGPPPEALEATGDKVRARRLAAAAGVSVVPGTVEPVRTIEEVHAFGNEHGYPVAIKAAAGGGGKGFRVAERPDQAESALQAAAREAGAYFGSAEVYLERYLDRPKHIEIQILAPRAGQTMWLGGRDCSLQRRHQKLVEETPPPRFAERLPDMGQAAVTVMNACGYVNAGTVEFLVDQEGSFFFLEVNARLQVEHTITEEVLGLDLVAAQLRIAAGDPLGLDPVAVAPRGHAIECRINAEDPTHAFLPHPGRLERYREPGGPGVRIDSGFGQGDEIPAAYDSLLAKAVAWAPTREEARRRMVRLLDEFEIGGVPTTIPAHRLLLDHPEFIDGSYTTSTVEAGALDGLGPHAAAAGPGSTDSDVPVLMIDGGPVRLWNPAMAPSVSAAVGAASSDGAAAIVAPMHGTILQILVAEGALVEAGDPVAILEAMKMETVLAATRSGAVRTIPVQPGQVVEAGEIVAVLE